MTRPVSPFVHVRRWRAAALAVAVASTGPVALAAQSTAPRSAAPAAGAADAFVHESWTVADGLPVNAVTSLIQSRDGYIWIGTFDGLVRFDGVRFTVFNTANVPGLPSNRITRVMQTADGSLLLATEQGRLVRFRNGAAVALESEHLLVNSFGPLLEDASGTIWVGTAGGPAVVQGDRLVAVAPEAGWRMASALLQRRDGSILVGTMSGALYRYDGQRASLLLSADALDGAAVGTLYEDGGRTVWIGTPLAMRSWARGTLQVHNRNDPPLAFSQSPRTGEVWAISFLHVFRGGPDGMQTVVTREHTSYTHPLLFPDSDGRMLYTTGPELHRDGQRIFSLLQAGVTALPAITAVLQDHEGSFWLGTHASGLHRLKPAAFTVYSQAEGLSTGNVEVVYEDREGGLWIGTQHGGAYRMAGGRIARMPESDGYPAHPTSFMQDRAGRMWIGSTGSSTGVGVCTVGGGCAMPAPNPIGTSSVLAMHEGDDGGLWFGTSTGLFRLAAGEWTRFDGVDGAPAAAVRAFWQTRDGALWAGTNGSGLVRYHHGRFTRVGVAEGLPLDLVRSLYQDADGWLWVGTEGRGLARLDPTEWGEPGMRGRITAISTQHGLFDDGIHQILEDHAGRLWMSTNRGIFWVRRQELLDFAHGRVPRINSVSYTERDGLRNREANGGRQPAGVKGRDGRLWFATQDGVAVVDPARVQVNAIPPGVAIELVRSGNSRLLPEAGSALRLGVDQRDLEIEYTALSFLAPANVRFRYRLEGYDADWVDAGGRRTAYYTGVPPGRYTFRAMASNNDGVWNEEGAALTLVLAPRFHETGLFRLLAALGMVLAVAGGVGLRVRGLRRRSRELERVVAQRTAELERERDVTARQAEALQDLDRARSRFFANVSHEFRTPLTLTIGPLEDLRASTDGEGRGAARRQLDMALRNARRLLRLVNQIMDVARLESGQMKLRARPHDLAGFASGVAAAFAAVAEQKRIEFTVDAPDDGVTVWFDADAMEKVLGNLLANAFKFTPDDADITLEVGTAPADGGPGVALLRVRDSGPGIPPEHLPHVFERFYQVDETATRAQPGTGIGLALTRELVELHGGTVTVSSDGGAVFTVTIPLDREHLRPDQLALDVEAPADHAVVEVGDERVAVRAAPVDLAALDPARAGATDDVTTLLVVDDSADLRAYVRSHFQDRIRVLEAADGAEGIALARQHLPDLVISDVMMPGTDGAELCRTLKEDPETDFIPVVLLTARATADDRVAGLVVGADDYLGKPFSMRELAARVDNLIASRRRLRERFAAERVEREERDAAAPADAAPVPADTEPQRDAADAAFLQRLNAVLDASIDNPDFGVAEMADAMFMDRTHLFRRTREVLQESPSDLLRRTRLDRAATLLRDRFGGVGEIAYAVGFNSVSHFCRCFRDQFGVSPSEFRDRAAVPG